LFSDMFEKIKYIHLIKWKTKKYHTVGTTQNSNRSFKEDISDLVTDDWIERFIFTNDFDMNMSSCRMVSLEVSEGEY
jgi:hypothetical protein